jgi:hypothetical protein
MRKLLFIVLAALLGGASASAQITIPNAFQAGQVIRSGEINTNFSTLGDKALNRILGGEIEGNVTVAADVTIDGIDLSDFLQVSGEVRAQTTGTAATPAFSWTGDTATGLYFPGVGSELGFALGGTSRMALTASGLTVWGTNIIDGSGKIPALTSTYFASLAGGNLTSLNASELTTGTVADARLSANVPLLNAATNTFTGNLVAVNGTFSGTLGVTGTSTLGTVNAGATAVSTFRMGTSATAGHVLTADASGNATWQAAGIASGAVPTGAIMMFQAACPSTWTRVSDWDDKFIRGGPTYSAVGGGSDTHSHSVDPPDTASASSGAHTHTVDPAAVTTSSNGAHTHSTFSTGGQDTNFTDLGHTHSGSTSTDGSHQHTMGTGSTFDAASGSNSAVNVSVTDSAGSHSHSFSTGGASTSMNHRHTIPASSTDSQGAHTHTTDVAATATDSQGAHTHSTNIASFTSATSSNVPAYVQVIFCSKD